TQTGGSAGGSVFRREGDYWTVAYEGKIVRLNNTKGMRHLARLLRHPGREFHSGDLVETPGTTERAAAIDPQAVVVSSLGDAGDLLDAGARQQYRRRLTELRGELEEAQRLHDLGRATRARAEMEALTRELVAATRSRKVASHTERARLAVT